MCHSMSTFVTITTCLCLSCGRLGCWQVRSISHYSRDTCIHNCEPDSICHLTRRSAMRGKRSRQGVNYSTYVWLFQVYRMDTWNSKSVEVTRRVAFLRKLTSWPLHEHFSFSIRLSKHGFLYEGRDALLHCLRQQLHCITASTKLGSRGEL